MPKTGGRQLGTPMNCGCCSSFGPCAAKPSGRSPREKQLNSGLPNTSHCEESETMPTKSDRMKVPKFATEAEEAKWWDERMDVVEEDLIAAMKDGTAQRNTAARLVKEARESRTITIRLLTADIELARRLAEQRAWDTRRT